MIYLSGSACDSGATFRLEAQPPFLTGEHPNAVVAKDFDKDGDVDLAVVGVVSQDLWIHENQGGGRFRALAPIPIEGQPLGADVGDLDDDGWLDLVVSVPGGAGVDVWLGQGALAFRKAGRVPLDIPYDVRLGDLDRNFVLDLVVSRFEPGGIWTALGDGHGGFAEPRLTEAGAGAAGMTVTDLDGDGRRDVGVACANVDQIDLFHGDGSGGLVALRAAPTGRWPSSVLAADLDGVPGIELLATANLGNSLVVVRATAGGAAGASDVPAGQGPIAAVAHDLDRDGRLEVVVTNKQENTISIHRLEAGALVTVATLPAGDGPTPLAVADVDGDGHADVVVANGFSNDVVVYLGR